MNAEKLLDIVVEIEEYESNDGVPAYVKLNRNGYKVFINKKFLSEHKDIEHLLVEGLKLHELSHIKYKTFSKNTELNNNVIKYIDNVLEDSRIEFSLSKEYPLAAKYLKVVIDAVKNELINKSSDIEDGLSLDKVIEYCDVLYAKVRFDTDYECKILNDEEKNDFLDFILPITLSSMRNNRKNCIDAANMIYRYITYDTDKDDIKQNIEISIKDNINSETIKNIKEVSDEIDKSCNTENFENEYKNIEVTEEKVFTEKIILEDIEGIKELSAVFKNVFLNYEWCESKDGEININKSQELYINSFTGDEGYNYIKRKKIEPKFELVILRDVSTSTINFKEEYAKVTIQTLEALKPLKNVDTMLIDFGNRNEVVKKFNDKEFIVYPKIWGSTALTEALCVQRSFAKNKKRIIIIFTDGRPDSVYAVEKELSNDFYIDVEVLPIIIKSSIMLLNNDVHIYDIKDLPLEIEKYFKERGIK